MRSYGYDTSMYLYLLDTVIILPILIATITDLPVIVSPIAVCLIYLQESVLGGWWLSITRKTCLMKRSQQDEIWKIKEYRTISKIVKHSNNHISLTHGQEDLMKYDNKDICDILKYRVIIIEIHKTREILSWLKIHHY